jgi:hypothetical protein
MKLQMEKGISLALTLMLLASFVAIGIPGAKAQTTTLSLEPSPANVYNSGEQVTFSCIVADVTNMYGFGIKIEWNTSELTYVSHTLTVPIETYPEGVLYSSVAVVKDAVDIPAGIYEAAATSLSPAPSFSGTGIIFNITFQALFVPWDFEITGDYIESLVEFTKDDLADASAVAIPHTTTDGIVRLWAKAFVYPIVPCLKVYPELYEAGALLDEFDSDVVLMGKNLTSGVLGDLDAFWDVAGIDAVMHFDPTLLEAIDVQIDPDGWFASFFDLGIMEIVKEIDNTTGTVHVAFVGYGEPHFAPFGQGRVFSVTFRAIYESETFPPPCAPIYLENPITYTGTYWFDSIGGLIDIADPLGTEWFKLTPDHGGNTPFVATAWDDNGDGVLSPSDQIILEGADGYYFDYHLDIVTGTLNLTQLPFHAIDADWLAMDGPTNKYTPWEKLWYTGASGAGYGVPNKTGNFSLTYPVDSVNYFEVNPQIGAPYNLTEGVDFVVNPDGTIDLLTPLDERVENEYIGQMPFGGNAGWPPIAYIASSFESVWIEMPNGTDRYALNLGAYAPPPSEYWYDDWFPYELESYWATGYYPGPWVWPDGTDVYINYTAAAFVTIDYNAFADPTLRYIEFNGSYADFLTALGAPTLSEWEEAYPVSVRDYLCTGYDDNDVSSDLSIGDVIYTNDTEGQRSYIVNDITTDLVASRKPWVCENDPGDRYFGFAPIVTVAGYPHPERDMCPWHGADFSISLPHAVENGEYCAPFKPLGGFIDVYTQYPDPFGGQGAHKPSDMFWPQKELYLCADVTYADWPEQNKDVAFQVIDPHGQIWGVYVNRTNTVGHTCVRVRLPWPCDDPEYYFGIWKVIATVDVACTVVNDTMEFKYDYKVRVWNVELDKQSYKHCEDIVVTIDYGSWATQEYNITFAITAVDASGVPFDFAYGVVTIGWNDHTKYCMYANGTIVLTVHVEKFARPPVGTIYVAAMSDFPMNGGSAETPVYSVQFTIEAEWAI